MEQNSATAATVSAFRNIFHFEEEEDAWKQVLLQFPNKVPRFATKAEAEDFTKQHCTRGSNPDTPHLLHSVTTLISWEQIEKHLLPRIRSYDTKWPAVLPSDCDTSANRFMKQQQKEKQQREHEESPDDSSETIKEGLMHDYLLSRLDLPIHRDMSFQSTLNTLKYLFFHMKCGIYVMIRNNEVALFCPFVNTEYRNTWSQYLRLNSPDGQLQTYYELKKNHYREENIIPDKAEWWANGNIICNEYSVEELGNQFWGDHFLLQLKDMFAETCRLRKVPDCEFFLNKRDYPQLKFNEFIAGGVPVEPYGFIFDRDDRVPEQDVPLSRHLYRSYAPILSFYSSSRFADIPMPPSEDWESATAQVFPASFVYSLSDKKEVQPAPARDLFTAANLQKFECPWGDKIPVAFFRGTATGGGVTPETNQRLHLAQLCYDWQFDSALNGKGSSGSSDSSDSNNSSNNSNGGYPFLDAKITGWNQRDKKTAALAMSHIRPRDFQFVGDRKKNFVPIYKQSTYKYLIYAEGHCAACRYGFMMQLGSVILKVQSQCVADSMWYFPLLQPFVDHVPVKADLSDLRKVLEWCHSNDDECQRIAKRAQQLYKQYISRDGIVDYLQSLCVAVSQRWRRIPDWCSNNNNNNSNNNSSSNNSNFSISNSSSGGSSSVPQLNIATSANYSSQQTRFCTEGHDGSFMCSYCESSLQRDEAAAQQQRLQNQLNAELQESNKLSEAERAKKRRKELAQKRKPQNNSSSGGSADTATGGSPSQPPTKRLKSN